MKTYITSPIYYVNDIPHIGHAYTTILCDMLKRFYRLQGREVVFLTGTDEHGQKIEQSAQKNNQSPQAYADTISARFRELWDSFGLEYDIFIRTTDSGHCLSVQRAFEIMYAKGDIYKGSYEGHYCISCESFFTQSQLGENGACPDCGKGTSIVQEESYFFALSKYAGRLLDFYRANKDIIVPRFRQDEVERFISEGLHDLSITRTSFEWGVPLFPHPARVDDKKHVAYVWLDALLSYLSGIGYLREDSKNMESSGDCKTDSATGAESRASQAVDCARDSATGVESQIARALELAPSGGGAFQRELWEHSVHFVGKDILRFHAVYWIAFLMSLELPLPRHIYAHGWWNKDGAKMSKSLGNVINPKEVAEVYGVEILRYFLLREMPFGQDGDFRESALIERINADLANDVGNLLNRLQGMSEKYFSLEIDCAKVMEYHADELESLRGIVGACLEKMAAMQPHRYIEELWRAFSLANGAIAKYEPWSLMKRGESERAMALLGLVASILAQASVLLYPIMPKSAGKIARALGFEVGSASYERLIVGGGNLGRLRLTKTEPLFPKVDKLNSSLEAGHSALSDKSAIDKARGVDEPLVLSPCSPCQSPDFSSQILECQGESLLKDSKKVSESTQDSELPSGGVYLHRDKNKIARSANLKGVVGERGLSRGEGATSPNSSPSPLDEKKTKLDEVLESVEVKTKDSERLDSESKIQAESTKAGDSKNLESATDSESAPSVIASNAKSPADSQPPLIDLTDFTKCDLRVGTIIECSAVPKSRKLLKLLVEVGEARPRQIISGIAQHYTPQSLVGRQICLILNLKPAKLMGLVSEGMILASKDGNGLSLLGLDTPRSNGSKIS